MSICFIRKKRIRDNEEEEVIDINGCLNVSVHKDCLTDDIHCCAGCEKYTMDEGEIEYEGCCWNGCNEDRPEYDEDGCEIEYD